MDVEHREPATPFLCYDGTVGELYPIFLLNLLLTIVTLGIWRFWAVTRMRRYVWSRTSHAGERLEYDGTGGQLFVGFLIAAAIIFGLYVTALVLAFVLFQVSHVLGAVPLILLFPTILTLALGAPFSAQRYRLNHTLWRGIRGGMQGSMIRYGLWSLLYFLASVLTLYQLLPWMGLRLYERRVNASFLGNLPFRAKGRALSLYLGWLATFVALVVLAAVVIGGLWGAESNRLRLFSSLPDPHMRQMVMASLMPGLLIAYGVFFVGASLIGCGFQALFLRHVAGHTSLGGVQFGSDVGGVALLGLVALNLVILVVTLGFGMPIVIHRNQRFRADHLLCTGSLDLSHLQQSPQTPSRYGEGMFQVLDAGAGLG